MRPHVWPITVGVQIHPANAELKFGTGGAESGHHHGIVVTFLPRVRGSGLLGLSSGAYSAGREADVLALWDSSRQREAYAWLGHELAKRRAAFRFSADREIITTITYLREVLGDQAYESLAGTGAQMTDAAMAAYALDQIDRETR